MKKKTEIFTRLFPLNEVQGEFYKKYKFIYRGI